MPSHCTRFFPFGDIGSWGSMDCVVAAEGAKYVSKQSRHAIRLWKALGRHHRHSVPPRAPRPRSCHRRRWRFWARRPGRASPTTERASCSFNSGGLQLTASRSLAMQGDKGNRRLFHKHKSSWLSAGSLSCLWNHTRMCVPTNHILRMYPPWQHLLWMCLPGRQVSTLLFWECVFDVNVLSSTFVY